MTQSQGSGQAAAGGTASYTDALRRSLLEGMVLLEGVVTQPIGLTHDLRTARTALMEQMGLGEGEDAGGDVGASVTGRVLRRERPAITREQAMDDLAIAQRTLDVLAARGGVERSLAERTGRVLARVGQRLGGEMRQQAAAKIRGLYVILDPQLARGRDITQMAEQVLKSGARVLQLRDKQSEKGLQLPVAKRLTELCEQHGALLIVNDHADLAAASGAHGLHVGQKDLPVVEARRSLAPRQLLGNSNATMDEAMASQQQGVDYLAVGAIFATTSKDNTRPAGLATLSRVREQAQAPLVAIGGINEGNVEQVIAAGADSVAVISAVSGADDPGQAAARMTERIERALARRGAPR
ncbi:MAG: thiamine phosphate synthase [Dehalococcoidia bacterium]|nr:thiamine phosphate synthase [Dehalococcoidia bacterium]